MAEHAAVFNHDSKRYEALLFQRGRVVPDPELNEMQRISRLRAYRTALAFTSAAGRREGHAGRPIATNLEIVPGANPDEIVIRPIFGSAQSAIISYHGYTIELAQAVTVGGFEEIAPEAGTQTQQIFMTLTEIEISSADDPEIRLAGLEETAVRTMLRVEFLLGEPGVDTAGEASTADEPWQGGTKSALLAVVQRYNDGTGVGLPITQEQILTVWDPPRDVAAFRDRNLILTGLESSGGVVRWDATTSSLEFRHVALVLPIPARGIAGPQIVHLDLDVTVPNDGDAVWLVLEHGHVLQGDVARFRQIYTIGTKESLGAHGPDSVNSPSWEDAGNTPTWRIVVAPAGTFAEDDDRLSGLFLLAVRHSVWLIFRDGHVIDGQQLSSTGGQVNTHAFGGMRSWDMPLRHFTASTAGALPTLRERFLPTTGRYKLLFEMYATSTTRCRTYYFRSYGPNQFTGIATTYNAYLPSSDVTADLLWHADDPLLPSTISRTGTRGDPPVPDMSFASRNNSLVLSWADDAWYHQNTLGEASIRRSHLSYNGETLEFRGMSRGRNTIFASAKIFVNAGTASVVAGFGITGITIGTTGGTYLVVSLSDTFVSQAEIVATVTSWDGTSFTSYVIAPIEAFHGAPANKALAIYGYKLISPGTIDFSIETARLSLIVTGAAV